jgi:hypothetical protein
LPVFPAYGLMWITWLDLKLNFNKWGRKMAIENDIQALNLGISFIEKRRLAVARCGTAEPSINITCDIGKIRIVKRGQIPDNCHQKVISALRWRPLSDSRDP